MHGPELCVHGRELRQRRLASRRWWTFGDGGAAPGRNPTHTYAAAGTYAVKLAVKDNDGATASFTKSVTVGGANAPPTASFTKTCTGLSCQFTDASSDSDGSIASRSWTFGDGGKSTARNPTHTYAAAGTYTVKLTVTDDDGATATVTKSVTVAEAGNAPPTASFTPDVHGPELCVHGRELRQRRLDPVPLVDVRGRRRGPRAQRRRTRTPRPAPTR